MTEGAASTRSATTSANLATSLMFDRRIGKPYYSVVVVNFSLMKKALDRRSSVGSFCIAGEDKSWVYKSFDLLACFLIILARAGTR